MVERERAGGEGIAEWSVTGRCGEGRDTAAGKKTAEEMTPTTGAKKRHWDRKARKSEKNEDPGKKRGDSLLKKKGERSQNQPMKHLVDDHTSVRAWADGVSRKLGRKSGGRNFSSEMGPLQDLL